MLHVASRCYASSHEELNLPNVSHKQSRLEDNSSSTPFLDDNGTDFTGDSKVIVNLKLNSHGGRHMSWCQASDEGYNDEEEEELPMESVSVFLPLSPEELTDPEMLRNTAATRIQALWRGYRTRKQLFGNNSHVSPAQRVVIDLARICMTLHRQQTMRLGERIDMLEQEIAHERAMRIAFENAIEDMALTIDKQQAMVCERMEEMRESYEERLYQEQCARTDLEQSMAHVLEKVQEMQNTQQQHAKQEAEERATLHSKLDNALAEIDQLKQQQQRKKQPATTLQQPSSTSRRHVNDTPSSSSTLEKQQSPRRSIKASSKPVRSSTHHAASTTTATRNNTKSLNATTNPPNTTTTTTTTTTTASRRATTTTTRRNNILSSSSSKPARPLARVDTRR